MTSNAWTWPRQARSLRAGPRRRAKRNSRSGQIWGNGKISDIAIFTPLDLVLLALVAGSPGAVIGALLGAWRWRSHRVFGALAGTAVGFALCLALALFWLTVVK